MALKCLSAPRFSSEQSLPRALTFALISLVLGPSHERDRNLERIQEICEATLRLSASDD